jgi:hypothetical protein
MLFDRMCYILCFFSFSGQAGQSNSHLSSPADTQPNAHCTCIYCNTSLSVIIIIFLVFLRFCFTYLHFYVLCTSLLQAQHICLIHARHLHMVHTFFFFGQWYCFWKQGAAFCDYYLVEYVSM